MGVLKKLHNDLLLSPRSKKYSRTSINWFMSLCLILFFVALGTAGEIFELIRNQEYNLWVPEFFFWGILAYGGGMGFLDAYKRKNEMNHGYYGYHYHDNNKFD